VFAEVKEQGYFSVVVDHINRYDNIKTERSSQFGVNVKKEFINQNFVTIFSVASPSPSPLRLP
jgi:hypothetical protein